MYSGLAHMVWLAMYVQWFGNVCMYSGLAHSDLAMCTAVSEILPQGSNSLFQDKEIIHKEKVNF